jgi:NAD(P)-dependent dehydrogenase (short-subunit alcohol dehydrogenase family)
MQMLDDHVVLITGAGSGLGLGLARYCLADGAQLALMEVSPTKVGSLRAEFGDKSLIVQGDVTKIDDILACKDAVTKRFGKLDGMICVHGIFDGMVPLKDTPLDKIGNLFDEVFHINVKGNILLARAFIDMLTATHGAIVLTASTAAYAADGGGLIYTASKGAVRSVVNQLAFEFAPHVRVTGVAPAAIANSQLRGPEALGMQNQLQSDIPKDIFLATFHQLSLLSDLPTPEQHGPLYAFLVSRHNKIMTGQTVVADQGLLNRGVLTQKDGTISGGVGRKPRSAEG